MENNKTKESQENALEKTNMQGQDLAVHSISSFTQAESLAEWIASSPVFNKEFKEVAITEDGKEQLIVNKSAIVTCLLLGNELGFSPMVSITFGKALNREAVIKVKRGEAMGLNPQAAMSNIYVFKTSQAEIVYTGIHVVNKVLTDAGVIRNIIDDASKPFYYYKYVKQELRDQEVLYDETTKNDYVVLNAGHPAEYIDSQVKSGKIPVLRYTTRRALVELVRGEERIAIPYTLQEAIDADLYEGTKTNGEHSKGKSNWNAHPKTHLIKMSIMLGARIIASDRLNGIYLGDEIPQITKTINDEHEYEEVQIIEDK